MPVGHVHFAHVSLPHSCRCFTWWGRIRISAHPPYNPNSPCVKNTPCVPRSPQCSHQYSSCTQHPTRKHILRLTFAYCRYSHDVAKKTRKSPEWGNVTRSQKMRRDYALLKTAARLFIVVDRRTAVYLGRCVSPCWERPSLSCPPLSQSYQHGTRQKNKNARHLNAPADVWREKSSEWVVDVPDSSPDCRLDYIYYSP